MNGERHVLYAVIRPVAVVAALGVAVGHLVDFGIYDLRIASLDSLTHASIAGVLSLGALAIAAIAALASSVFRSAARLDYVLLAAALCGLLVLRLAQPSHVLVAALPFTAAAFYLLWMLAPPGSTRRVLREGCVVLALSLALHAVGTWLVSALGYGADSWPYQIKAVLKHSLELAGWVLIAGGLLSLAMESARGRAARLSQPLRRASYRRRFQ